MVVIKVQCKVPKYEVHSCLRGADAHLMHSCFSYLFQPTSFVSHKNNNMPQDPSQAGTPQSQQMMRRLSTWRLPWFDQGTVALFARPPHFDAFSPISRLNRLQVGRAHSPRGCLVKILTLETNGYT